MLSAGCTDVTQTGMVPSNPPDGHFITSLSYKTVKSLDCALHICLYLVKIYHEAWENLEVSLANKVAKATGAHIGALRGVVSQSDQTIEELRDAVSGRDEVVQCLKLKLAREQEYLARLQEKQEEREKLLEEQETELNEHEKQLTEQVKQLKEQEALLNEQKTLLNKQHQPAMLLFLFAVVLLLELWLLLK